MGPLSGTPGTIWDLGPFGTPAVLTVAAFGTAEGIPFHQISALGDATRRSRPWAMVELGEMV